MRANMEPGNEWLEQRLRGGESPLLPKSDWEFIARVRSNIMQEAATEANFTSRMRDFFAGVRSRIMGEDTAEARFPHLEHKVPNMVDNFGKVVSYLEKNSKWRNSFMETYPRWDRVREQSILQLSWIAGSLHHSKQDFAVVRTLGNSVSIVGGVITFASGINPFVRIFGTAVMGLGTVLTSVSSFAELDRVKQEMKKALRVLENDQRCSKKLFELLGDGSCVEEAINDIKSEVDWDIQRAVDELLKVYYEERRKIASDEELDKKIRIVLEILDIPKKQAKEIADVIGILMSLYMLRKHHRLLFKVASEGFKLFKGSLKYAVAAFDLMEGACAVKNSTGQLTSAKKFMLGVSMALSAVNIYLTAKDFNTLSKEVEMINKAVNQLRQEKSALENIYRHL